MSKSRGPTKAQQILQASKNRLDTAEQSLSETYIAVERAKAVRDALMRAHYDLEVSRKQVTEKSESATVGAQ